jgi:hypothetical protein
VRASVTGRTWRSCALIAKVASGSVTALSWRKGEHAPDYRHLA